MTATIPSITLTALKLGFLALLYLFVYRIARAIVADLRQPKRAAPAPAPQGTGAASGQAQTAAPAAAPVPMKRKGKAPASIAILDQKGKRTRAFKLTGPIQIGRADACHLRLPDTYVSQFHARIYPQDGAWFVEDLGSTNGTFLNQRKVTSPSEVRAGDRVRIGTTTLELKA
jgi:pSer/pThr/pTyr-binding forkhead associated (FHA) protein